MSKLTFLILAFISCSKSPFLENTKKENIVSNPSLMKENIFLNIEELEVFFYWDYGPELYEYSTLIVLFKDADSMLNDPTGDIEAKIWMNEMATPHGSAPILVEKISSGIYRLTNILFSMEGNWDLHLSIIKDDFVIDELVWQVNL